MDYVFLSLGRRGQVIYVVLSYFKAGMEGYVKLGWVAFRYGWQVWQHEVSSDKARFGRQVKDC